VARALSTQNQKYIFLVMSPNSSNNSDEAVTSTGDKAIADHVEASFDIDRQDLPKGYFLRPFFVGTLIASGLSVSAVSSLLSIYTSN
jgi:hypothetical protein